MDYSDYKELHVRRVEPGILEIVMGEEGGKLSVTTARMHGEMARIWLDIDRDPETRVAILRGAGKGFSAGGDLAMVEEMTRDFAVRARVWREAKDLVYNLINCSKLVVSAMHGPAVGAGLVAGPVNLLLGLWAGGALPNPLSALSAAVVGFMCYGVSLIFFVLALRQLGAARTAAYFSVAPFFGAAVAIVMFNEPVTSQLIAAGLLMAVGVWLHATERHEHEHVHPPQSHSHPHLHDESHSHSHAPGDPAGEPHTHPHVHESVTHSHPHTPDMDHQHRH